jgi:predicted ATPase
LELEGLDVPADEAELERAAASQLFLQSARRSAPNRVIADSDRRHITRICEIVQGHPLALIVAAHCLRTLSCPEIAAELEVGFDLLEDVAGELTDRQHTLRQILEWSVRQLAGADQEALRRMAVFRGGFEREAVHRVAGVTLLQLRALCDASLLNMDDTGRYRMHELVRRYAAEQLSRTPDDKQQQWAYSEDIPSHREILRHWRGEMAIEIVGATNALISSSPQLVPLRITHRAGSKRTP